MKVLEITSREFREKQKTYFELADKGEQVVIKRGKKQAYILTPIMPDDMQISPEMEFKIFNSIQAAKEGRTIKVSNKDDLHEFLDSL